MSNIQLQLEMRKKSIGFGLHLFHFVLFMLTGFWGIIWLCHWLSVVFHNKAIEKQQDRILMMEIEGAQKR